MARRAIERSTTPSAGPRSHADPGRDVNIVVAGLLSDLATIQTSVQRHWGYRRAARAIRWLEESLEDLRQPDGALPRIVGIGPASLRVIEEVLRTGGSEWVELESGRTYGTLYYDWKEMDNLRYSVEPFFITEDENLYKLRNFDYGQLSVHTFW